jgi:hypothetical protein
MESAERTLIAMIVAAPKAVVASFARNRENNSSLPVHLAIGFQPPRLQPDTGISPTVLKAILFKED